jgi:hypothetical protein
MTTELIQFDFEDGGAILVEVDDDEPGIERANRVDDLARQASHTLDMVLEQVGKVAEVTVAKLRSRAGALDSLEVEFGVRLNAEAGAVIAKTEAEGHIQVRMTWIKPS